MTDRKIEERFEFDNGIKGEWEPTGKTVAEREARRVVAEMNRKNKAEKSALRYRSVPGEE